LGGILHRRAISEFNSAKILFEHGVPTYIPLAVLLYEDKLQYRGEPMGVVMTISPSTDYQRLSDVQFSAVQPGTNPEGEAYYLQIHKALEINENPMSEKGRLKLICVLARQMGAIVNGFSSAGLYRHSSEWSNFSFDIERRQVLFTDLDSSLPMSGLKEELRLMHSMRDLGSLLYRTLAKFYTPTALGEYTLTNLLTYDPIFELLRGYFPESEDDQLQKVSKKLWRYYAPHFALLKKHRESIWNDWSTERRKSYKMDHDLFYILVMTATFPLFANSDLSKRYPMMFTEKDLLAKAKNYLGERFGYFEYIMDDSL
jgi:hypothetical protein